MTLIEDAPAPERPDDGHDHHNQRTQRSLFDPAIVGPAIGDSFRKLNPRDMARNPVMFIVEIGAVLTTVLCITDWTSGTAGPERAQQNVFALLVTIWLWATVLFANFAEAMAEGRGKAQADTLRRTRSESVARIRTADGIVERASSELQIGDECVVTAGEVIHKLENKNR